MAQKWGIFQLNLSRKQWKTHFWLIFLRIKVTWYQETTIECSETYFHFNSWNFLHQSAVLRKFPFVYGMCRTVYTCRHLHTIKTMYYTNSTANNNMAKKLQHSTACSVLRLGYGTARYGTLRYGTAHSMNKGKFA